MSRFIFVTDTHFRTKTPICRIDNFLENTLKEYEWVLKRAIELGASIIFGGDLFDSPSPSDFVANAVAELIDKYRVKHYVIQGNHDVIGGNRTSYRHTKLGLYRFYKNFVLLGETDCIEKKDCIIKGWDFSKEFEVPENIDYDYKADKMRIYVVHGMIATEPEIVVNNKKKLINPTNIHTNGDIILCGYYHPGFEITLNKLLGIKFVNPGALGRMNINDLEREPKIAVIEILDKDHESVRYEIVPHNKKVYNEKWQGNKSEIRDGIKFATMLEQVSDEEFMGENVISILDNLKNRDLKDDIRKLLSDKVLNRCKSKIEGLMK